MCEKCVQAEERAGRVKNRMGGAYGPLPTPPPSPPPTSPHEKIKAEWWYKHVVKYLHVETFPTTCGARVLGGSPSATILLSDSSDEWIKRYYGTVENYCKQMAIPSTFKKEEALIPGATAVLDTIRMNLDAALVTYISSPGSRGMEPILEKAGFLLGGGYPNWKLHSERKAADRTSWNKIWILATYPELLPAWYRELVGI